MEECATKQEVAGPIVIECPANECTTKQHKEY